MWPGYHMFTRKQCRHQEVSELWVWWMHWNIIGVKLAYYLKLFWSMWCPKISSSRSLCKGLVLYPAKNEEIYGIVPHITLLWKRKLHHVGQWVKWVNRRDPLSTLLWIAYESVFSIVHRSQIFLKAITYCVIWIETGPILTGVQHSKASM